jgi:hypothetical protein
MSHSRHHFALSREKREKTAPDSSILLAFRREASSA